MDQQFIWVSANAQGQYLTRQTSRKRLSGPIKKANMRKYATIIALIPEVRMANETTMKVNSVNIATALPEAISSPESVIGARFLIKAAGPGAMVLLVRRCFKGLLD